MSTPTRVLNSWWKERRRGVLFPVEGNLEFLVREALQPPTLHELPDFKWAYDVMLEGLTAMKNMRDTEFEKRTESLYWTSYVGRSILSIREELEDPDAKEWSSSTIRLFCPRWKKCARRSLKRELTWKHSLANITSLRL